MYPNVIINYDGIDSLIYNQAVHSAIYPISKLAHIFQKGVPLYHNLHKLISNAFMATVAKNAIEEQFIYEQNVENMTFNCVTTNIKKHGCLHAYNAWSWSKTS